MKSHLMFLTFLFLFLTSWAGTGTAKANSEIYPAENAAKQAIHWKDGYFVVNGKPTFLTGGEMHYARIPRELWKDRIWRAKAMGFNCIQTYVFWNASEDREGHWNFADNTDLDAWLKEIEAAGLFAIVRVGPYCCAEWEHGGIPAWLSAKPNTVIRENDAAYLQQVDRYLAQVEAIIARHQIHKGGGAIMVQLENEYLHSWGTDKTPYLQHLYEQARANGLEIPLFFSGLHHGAEPSGQEPFPVGNTPWFTTEFWTGWIAKYGDMETGMLNQKIAGTWKIIAFGGGGYSYYMVHGGSNFGYSGDSFMASYDYSAPIGETGEFHNLYHPARRAAWFARSFNALLTSSHDDPGLAAVENTTLRVTARTIPTGSSFVLIDNFQHKLDPTKQPQLPPDAAAYLPPGEPAKGDCFTRVTVKGATYPRRGAFAVSESQPAMLLLNIPSGRAVFSSVCANVMFRAQLGRKDVWVCHGRPGETAEVTVIAGGQERTVAFTCPRDDSVKETTIDTGDESQALFLAVNTEAASRSWFAHGNLYFGPSFVRADGSLEFPPTGGKAVVYSPDGRREITGSPVTLEALPELTGWQWRDAAPERRRSFDDSAWVKSAGPVPMGRLDGFQNRYGWYRASFVQPTAETTKLVFGHRYACINAWLNDRPVDLANVPLEAGQNTLAILVKLNPRPKWYMRHGPVGDEGYGGLWQGFSRDSDQRKITAQWTVKLKNPGYEDPRLLSQVSPKLNAGEWKAVSDLSVNKGGNAFIGSFTLSKDEIDGWLDLSGVNELKAALNGRVLDASDPECRLREGENRLYLWGNVKQPRKLAPVIGLRKNLPLAHTPWRMHGGLAGLDETAIVGRVTNWAEFLAQGPWQTTALEKSSSPLFWKTKFTYRKNPSLKETISLVKTQDSLKAGHVWLNGHNLGECPQKEPLYMPEPWLNEGDNDLVIFDFFGCKPTGVELKRNDSFGIKKPQ